MARILLFDDDYESMLPLVTELEELGYRVDLTADEEILTRLATTTYDLICVDFMIHPQSPGQADDNSVISNVHYPGVNWQRTGQEFLRRLRSGEYDRGGEQGTRCTVPAIIISATAKSGEKYDAAAFFEKPFDIDEILKTIDSLLQTGTRKG